VPQDYARVIQSLNEHEVEFVIIGGVAAGRTKDKLQLLEIEAALRLRRKQAKER